MVSLILLLLFLSAGEMKWHPVIQNKLIGLIQTVHFEMSFCDHQVFPTSPLTHHTCSPKSCQVDMLRQAYKHTVSQCSLSSMRQQTGTGVHECVCVCERKSLFEFLCALRLALVLWSCSMTAQGRLSVGGGERCTLVICIQLFLSSGPPPSLVAPHPNMCHPIFPVST